MGNNIFQFRKKLQNESVSDEEKLLLQAKARKVAMIISIIDIVAGAMGIYAFYIGSSLISILGGIVIALSLIQILLGHQIIVPILAAVIGWVAVGEFWPGVCIGMCYEAVITGFFAYVLVAIAKIKGPPPAPLSEVIAEQAEKTEESIMSDKRETAEEIEET